MVLIIILHSAFSTLHEVRLQLYVLNSNLSAPNNSMKLKLFKAKTDSRVPIPYATSEVKAGFPSPAQDYMSEEIDLNIELIHNREATFYVRVSGDSMTDAGIFDGDLAVVDKSLEASDGDFVIAFIDGDFTIKQFQRDADGQRGWLVPWNKRYPRIEVNASNQFVIWGVVTYVIHALKR